MGFLFTGGYLPRWKFIWSEDLMSSFLLSIIDRELFCFPLIFSFLLSSDLRLGILLFLFFSFFSFLPFLLNAWFDCIFYLLCLYTILGKLFIFISLVYCTNHTLKLIYRVYPNCYFFGKMITYLINCLFFYVKFLFNVK